MQPVVTVPKKYIFGALALIFVVIAVALWLNRPAKLTVTTDSSADIYFSTEQNGEFQKIGTGTAKYSTRKLPAVVYVKSVKGNNQTISGASLKRGKAQTIKLELGSTITPQVISTGSMSNALIEGTLIQGVVPIDASLISYKTDDYMAVRPELVGLPNMSKISWFDKNNFVYKSTKDVIGQFSKAVDNGESGIARQVQGVSNLKPIDEGSDSPEPRVALTDFSRTPGKPMIFLSADSLFTSDDMGYTIKYITTHPKGGELERIYTSPDSIFWFTGDAPSDELSEGNTKDFLATQTNSIVQYDYTGNKVREFTAAGQTLTGVTSLNNSVYVLTDKSLTVITNNTEQVIPLYFKNPADMVVYKGKVLILTRTGVWAVGKDNASIQLLSATPGDEQGLKGSFSLNPDGRLLFSTVPGGVEAEENKSALYSLSF